MTTPRPDLFEDSPHAAAAVAVQAPAPAAPRRYGPDLGSAALGPRQLTVALRLLECSLRNQGYHLTDAYAEIRQISEKAEKAREASEGLKGLADRVWSAVYFAATMNRARLRRELLQEQHLNQILAAAAIDCVNVLFDNLADTRRRLCALEAAVGLPVGAAPVAEPPARKPAAT
jgi:hypothetical protein